MKIIVEQVDNGYIMEYLDEDKNKRKEVIQDEGELECMARLLLQIKEHFGIFHNKHSEMNLVVRVENDK